MAREGQVIGICQSPQVILLARVSLDIRDVEKEDQEVQQGHPAHGQQSQGSSIIAQVGVLCSGTFPLLFCILDLSLFFLHH